MSQLTRQEIQRLLDTTRNQILDRVLTRQDLVAVNENIRDRMMNYMQDLAQVQQQNIVRKNAGQTDEITRRIVALESRICNMEQEIKTLLHTMQRAANQHPQPTPIALPKNDSNNYSHTPEQRYVYGVS